MRNRTTRESIITDRSNTVADDHARQAGAILERRITDRSYAVGDEHARQAGARTERRTTNRSYAVGDDDTRETRTLIERRIRNHLGIFVDGIRRIVGVGDCNQGIIGIVFVS